MSWDDECPEEAQLTGAQCDEICCSEFVPGERVSRYACAQAGGYDLEVDPRWLAAVEPVLEAALARGAQPHVRPNGDTRPRSAPKSAPLSLKLTRNGRRGIVEAKWLFEAQLGNIPRRYERLRMAWVWRLDAAEIVRW